MLSVRGQSYAKCKGQSYNIHLDLGRPARDLREMARKSRLEFAGAIYHVLSRGNYRKELFDEGSAKLFEKTLLRYLESASGSSMRM